MTVSEELKNRAIKLGLCQEWTKEWKSPNLDELVEMYITGIDFCIQNSYPSNKYIKENFGRIAENHGVYTDTDLGLINPDIVILNGSCKAKVELNGFISRDIYVRHNSELTITIKDSAMAFIRAFDTAKIKVINLSNKKVFVYRYSKSTEIDGDIIIREKELA